MTLPEDKTLRSRGVSASVRRLALLFLGVLALGGRRRIGRPAAAGACVPGLPGHEPVEPARRQAAGRAQLGRIVAAIGADDTRARRLRLRALGGRADRDPDHGRPRHAGEVARPVRVRGRVGQGPVSDPGERRDRGRPRLGRRPARADRRPRPLQALRALRALPDERRWLAGRLRGDLRPALEQAAPGRLDVRRRGRAADPARARALRGRGEGPDRPRAPLHRRRTRAAPTSGRRGTSRATRPTRTCRRWGCASG